MRKMRALAVVRLGAQAFRVAKLLVNIDVDDLERGVAFYTGAFELTVGRRLGSGVVESRVGAQAATVR